MRRAGAVDANTSSHKDGSAISAFLQRVFPGEGEISARGASVSALTDSRASTQLLAASIAIASASPDEPHFSNPLSV
jgi:hypothetical protein